jgi:predicted Zn-dependent protease
VAERAERSFQSLTDPVALNIQPQHVDILTLGASSTIALMLGQRSSPVTGAELALINQVETQTPFASGRLVKWVIGTAQPVP